ncbi:MAG: hypothetical protein HKN43_16400, partial [Rhodothermales bacterium]|nr:hypothetical protein [Rhodothermales bacterium]
MLKRLPEMLLVALIAMTFVSGCDGLEVQDIDEFVVEAYLIANTQLPVVRLSRTTDLDTPYNFTNLVVNGASARIDLLSPDGSVETSFLYEERDNLYWPVGNHMVMPARTYKLHVDIP